MSDTFESDETIIMKIWKILGIENYKQAQGKSIDELIDELIAGIEQQTAGIEQQTAEIEQQRDALPVTCEVTWLRTPIEKTKE